MYRFTDRAGDLEALILESFDSRLILSGGTQDTITLFSNGDRMDIDLAARTMAFDGVRPTDPASSRLNWKRHKRFVDGVIVACDCG